MPRLSPEQRLLLQQLRLLEWINTPGGTEAAGTNAAARSSRSAPAQWTLTRGWDLQEWQERAVQAWFDAGCRGTMKVVTGAGKTVIALALAERLQRQRDPELRLAIVVPTIVLMNQWYRELVQHSDLPPQLIGRMGGGFSDDFTGRRILISVLASARRFLPRAVEKAGVGQHLLLIADECHRTGAPEMAAVLKTPRAYNLGLSATPEREEEAEVPQSYQQSQLGEELGAIVYEMSVAQAVELGVLPPFQLEHYGLSLTVEERQKYERISRSLNDLRSDLKDRSATARKAGAGEAFLTWCRRVASKGDGELSRLAARYVAEMTERKQLLYGAEARRAATLQLLRAGLAASEETRAILFHESIEQVVALFEALWREGMPVVMEQSALPDELREASIDLFREGTAKVVVSARSLIEGFNVPAADLGIIVASSSSTRQRIQSIGRVLRRHRSATGEEKQARICVLYARDTVDELIYEKEDWERLVGVGRNTYFQWDPPQGVVPQSGPPRAAIPRESAINLSHLQPGDPYPGRYEGDEYTTDTHGNVMRGAEVALNPQNIPDVVSHLKGSAGRFKVTPLHNAILVLVSEADGWKTLYGGRLQEPFRFESPVSVGVGSADVGRLEAGQEYSGPLQPAEQYTFKQKRGGVISRRVSGGEVYAVGATADQLVLVLRQLVSERGPISRFFINQLGHAFWREKGKALFVAATSEPLRFPGEGQS